MGFLDAPSRRLGTGLLAFGLAGALLAGLAAIGLLAAAVSTRDLDDRLVGDQGSLVASLRRTGDSLGRLAGATENAGLTLTASRDAVLEARLALDELADASEELSRSLDVTLLGQRPFSGAAARFGSLAGRVRTLDDQAGRLADSLAANRADADALADEAAALERRVRDVATKMEGFAGLGGPADLLAAGVLLAALVMAWVAVAGALCAAAGWRIRRAWDGVPPAGPAEPLPPTVTTSG